MVNRSRKEPSIDPISWLDEMKRIILIGLVILVGIALLPNKNIEQETTVQAIEPAPIVKQLVVPPLPTPPPPTCESEIEKYDWDRNIAYGVMMAESSGREDARGDVTLTYYRNGIRYGDSWGCFQIRYLPERLTPDQLVDPVKNVEIAYTMSKSKRGWKHWTMYNNGKYRQFMLR